jgi:flagellar basal-body rod protein FlgF
MNVGLYRSAVAMVTQAKRLETVAANLANLGTVGYKRGASATHQFEVQRGKRTVRGLTVESKVDFSQGNLHSTGRDLDMALSGEGFFAVETQKGEEYTRDGSFHLTPEGVLVTEDGFPVAWEKVSGNIDPAGDPVYVDREGNVSQSTARVGRLRIVDFLDKSQLSHSPNGLWQAPAGLAEAAPAARVHQYSLEDSNANGMAEMISMIEVQRAFESTSNVLSSIEQSYRRLTRPF